MRDLHCHILPGVDDGARDLDESLRMLAAARSAGITRITCTPHCRDPYFDFDAMWAAFRTLEAHAGDMPLQMGFEVNVAKLTELGMDWAERLHFDGSNEFLLELQVGATETDFREYARIIYELQGRGDTVVIAHPERDQAIQKRPELARELMGMGCRLQASADFLTGGRGAGTAKRTAKKLFDELDYTYIASDAHRVEHYATFAKAWADYPRRGLHMAV